MKNILLIYPYQSQHNLIINFASYLSKHGVVADYICIDDYSYSIQSGIKWPKVTRLLFDAYNKTRNRIARKYINLLLSRSHIFLKRIIKKYEFIDFHVASFLYLPYMRYCDSHKIIYDITLWGSEVMRTDEGYLLGMKYGFEHCRYIKSTDNLRETLNRRTGNRYDPKIKTLFFGNSNFATIEAQPLEQSYRIKDSLLKADKQALIIVCGYNAKLSQNHLDMIKAIDKVSSLFNRKVHLVFPLTYEKNEKYIHEIRNIVNEIGVPYTLLTNYLSLEDLVAIRKCSDIVINIQDTDALAGSLQDHLFCGSVCVFGDWLAYHIYDNNNVYYIKTNLIDLPEHILTVVNHYEDYVWKCRDNHEIMKRILSWESVIKDWVDLYLESLLSGEILP